MRYFQPAIISCLVLLTMSLSTLVHAQDFNIRLELTNVCLEVIPKEDQMTCVGKAAEACMTENNGGETTVGMSSCISLELDWWDMKLNKAYPVLLEREKSDDKDAKTYQFSVPEKAPALKEMQRKWIGYRDALCGYEVSQWGGGTGSGPAYASCMMTETARQYFVLQNKIATQQ